MKTGRECFLCPALLLNSNMIPELDFAWGSGNISFFVLHGMPRPFFWWFCFVILYDSTFNNRESKEVDTWWYILLFRDGSMKLDALSLLKAVELHIFLNICDFTGCITIYVHPVPSIQMGSKVHLRLLFCSTPLVCLLWKCHKCLLKYNVVNVVWKWVSLSLSVSVPLFLIPLSLWVHTCTLEMYILCVIVNKEIIRVSKVCYYTRHTYGASSPLLLSIYLYTRHRINQCTITNLHYLLEERESIHDAE